MNLYERALKGNCGTNLPGQGIKNSCFFRPSVNTVRKSDKRFRGCSQNKYLPCCPMGAAILFILPRVQHSTFWKCGSCSASPIVFYRYLDGCKTMHILRNVLKSDTNKGVIMSYNEQWSFSMEFYSKSSKLP